MKQLVLDLASPAEPTLDNFVAGPNAEALQAMRDLAAGARRDPVIYLFGPGGSGRTHLLRAV
ncbi:MAG: DnaA regulatory inactivator Hda, partial [Betaproteobacteria bacterium]|nr:DnaA regulatory inactivator Hda [Betaproteobacteria bacterium]